MTKYSLGALYALASLKIILGMTAVFQGRSVWTGWEPPHASPITIEVHFLFAFVLGAVAFLLIFGRAGDSRPLYLGGIFLLFGTLFTNRMLFFLANAYGPYLSDVFTVFARLPVDAFLPFFMWLFVRDFPRQSSFGRYRFVTKFFITASVTVGGVFFASNVVLLISDHFDGSFFNTVVRDLLTPRGELYWDILILLALPALAYSVWNARNARPIERRRVNLFVAGLVLGSGPMAVEVLLESLIPSFGNWMSNPGTRRAGGFILYPLLLLFPLITAYSVLVHHVLDVKLVVRKALRYALARYTILALVVAPVVWLSTYIYQRRHETVTEILSGSIPLALVGAVTIGWAVLLFRRRLFNTVDRWFFREQYDARRILTGLIEKSRQAESIEGLTGCLRREIDNALHPEVVAVFILQPCTGTFVSSQVGFRQLEVGSTLATQLAKDQGPLELDLEHPDPRIENLRESERYWVADGGFRFLFPLIGSDGLLLGILGIGDKKSELPYSGEDRSLLTAISAAGALNLENRLMRVSAELTMTPKMLPVPESFTKNHQSGVFAFECRECNRVFPPGPTCCSCGGNLIAAPIPYQLAGKFRFEERVGAGGMGVVYRARDLDLERQVAVKTLPNMSAAYAMRLRREARAMASVLHPNLVLIFGAETWNGTPMLIFEYLNGGTLSERIARSPLCPRDAMELGIVMAEVLERIHTAGVLHCDIKPSNIGYTAEGVPKLLDFGLARILYDSNKQGAMGEDQLVPRLIDEQRPSFDPIGRALQSSHQVVGTPLYMSPEAVDGQPPDESFDLWSTNIVIYESIAGRNPVRENTLRESMERISRAEIPDLREVSPDCPMELAKFMKDALAKNKRDRPSSAKELKDLLRCVKASC